VMNGFRVSWVVGVLLILFYSLLFSSVACGGLQGYAGRLGRDG
jgi:hypothetical protein